MKNDVIDQEIQTQIRAVLNDETIAKLKALARDKGVSIECLVAELVEQEIYG